MTDARLFSSDDQRARAIEVRRLMLRLENGSGADRNLGADILNAVDAPTGIGDVTGCIDCAWHLARFLKQPASCVHEMATRELSKRVQAGWKTPDAIGVADAARAITLILLRVELAKLERAPA